MTLNNSSCEPTKF